MLFSFTLKVYKNRSELVEILFFRLIFGLGLIFSIFLGLQIGLIRFLGCFLNILGKKLVETGLFLKKSSILFFQPIWLRWMICHLQD